MATQKNGCGFLITALVLLVLGGIVAAFLFISAASTGKDLVEDINNGVAFNTPETLDYTSDTDGEVTVWFTSDTEPSANSIKIEITDEATGETTIATTSGHSGTIENLHLVAVFSVTKGANYKIKAKGATDGQTFRISPIDSAAVLSMIGKGLGALGVFGVCALLALIFGIIGLVKFFNAKNATSAPPIA